MNSPERDLPAGRVPLVSVEDGGRARVMAVEGGTGLRMRLVAMGLRPGVELRVVRNGGRGPFVLAIDACRIVLGRGMAHKILVAPLRPAGERA